MLYSGEFGYYYRGGAFGRGCLQDTWRVSPEKMRKVVGIPHVSGYVEEGESILVLVLVLVLDEDENEGSERRGNQSVLWS